MRIARAKELRVVRPQVLRLHLAWLVVRFLRDLQHERHVLDVFLAPVTPRLRNWYSLSYGITTADLQVGRRIP